MILYEAALEMTDAMVKVEIPGYHCLGQVENDLRRYVLKCQNATCAQCASSRTMLYDLCGILHCVRSGLILLECIELA